MIIGTLQQLNQLDSSHESIRQEVRRIKIIKYLGMMIDGKLVWDQHVDCISSKIT